MVYSFLLLEASEVVGGNGSQNGGTEPTEVTKKNKLLRF